MNLNLTCKEVTGKNAPVGAALVAQAMDRRNGAGRYQAMQSIKDWDSSRLAYIAKRGVVTDLKIVLLTVVEVFTGGGAC